MHNDFNPDPDTHTYKIRPWVILLNLFNLILLGCMVIPLGLIIAVVVSSNQTETNYGELPLILLFAFTPVIVMLGFVTIQLILSFLSIFSSYIKITPEGIENKIWPYRHIRSRWSEVDRLGTFFFHEVIYLKSYEVIGLSLSHTWPLKVLNFYQPSIALSTYNGWPNGQLASDLRHYAPHLFENHPIAEEAHAPNQGQNGSGISQENRLLAALSHASVLFSGIGAIVPIVIYLTQKKRSAFLAFHALQAFFYQLIGFLFSVIFPFCLVGTVFIPAIGASASGNENAFGSFFGITMIITMAIAMLVAFGSLAYVIYGIIGAIVTYQGRDFHYVIIGKRVEKGNH